MFDSADNVVVLGGYCIYRSEQYRVVSLVYTKSKVWLEKWDAGKSIRILVEPSYLTMKVERSLDENA